MLSRNDLRHTVDCLKLLQDYQSNRGCNDMVLPDTASNRGMLKEACWANDPTEVFEPNIYRGNLLTQDYWVTFYLRNKIENLLNFLETADDKLAAMTEKDWEEINNQEHGED